MKKRESKKRREYKASSAKNQTCLLGKEEDEGKEEDRQ
jgi:hypothetical protein